MNTELYINSGKLRSLYPVLNSWIENIDLYLQYFGNSDCPWWYNERATLSSLAAAIWKNGGVALEEYSIDKGAKSKEWIGRCDLFIGLQSNTFACEAKQAWCPIGRRAKNGVKIAKQSLEAACKDARKLPKEEGTRLGICFAVPYLPSQDSSFIDVQLTHWLEEISKIDYDAIAWRYPIQALNNMKSSINYYHPGVTLLIKEVYRKA
jgi:hypothetical protein